MGTPGERRRVLIVDDDEGIRGMLSSLLRDEGYAVAVAVDGMDGLRRAADWKPHVILCDLVMPRMNGYDFIETYRRETTGPRAAVLAMTAAGPAAESAARIGPDDVVTKPYDVDRLLELVAHHARRREPD